jgi:hypothetical protein
MPVDDKYGRVTLENANNIGDDEPVFVFRAKDQFLPNILRTYRYLCQIYGSPATHLASIDATLKRVKQWQSWNEIKLPDTER